MKESQSNMLYLQENRISALSFSHKADYCAIATKKDHMVHIYRVNKLNEVNSWTLLQDIKDHSQTIGDIDWAADNKLLTSSHDRSVFGWKQISDFKWERMLVNIDIKLSILTSKWAPNTKKFALGSACNTIALGFYNVDEHCWTVSTRNHNSKNPISTSPITTLCFHPSSNILAVGTADFTVKIVTSSFKKSKDPMVIKSKVEEDSSYKGPFDDVDSLFEILFTLENVGGWINYISFENNGSNVLILPHLNRIKILHIGTSSKIVEQEEEIRWNGLPFLSGYITQNRDLILGGFDKKVAKFSNKSK
jgi:actin related protein 2/3 complex, subunit 1A/1B